MATYNAPDPNKIAYLKALQNIPCTTSGSITSVSMPTGMPLVTTSSGLVKEIEITLTNLSKEPTMHCYFVTVLLKAETKNTTDVPPPPEIILPATQILAASEKDAIVKASRLVDPKYNGKEDRFEVRLIKFVPA